MPTKAKTPKVSAVEPVEPARDQQRMAGIDAAVVNADSTGPVGLVAVNHKTLDKEIEYQEKAVAALGLLYQTELETLKALRAERDSQQRQDRRATENEDGTVRKVAS